MFRNEGTESILVIIFALNKRFKYRPNVVERAGDYAIQMAHQELFHSVCVWGCLRQRVLGLIPGRGEAVIMEKAPQFGRLMLGQRMNQKADAGANVRCLSENCKDCQVST